MSKLAERLVTVAEEDLRAAAILLPTSTRHAAIWVYHASAMLLEAIVRVDVTSFYIPRGPVERLRNWLPIGSPFATDVWTQIDPTWSAEAYDLLIGCDGTITPDPPEDRVHHALRGLRSLVPEIRGHIRQSVPSTSQQQTGDPMHHPRRQARARLTDSIGELLKHNRDENGPISPAHLGEVLGIGIVEVGRLLQTAPDELREGWASADVQSKLTAVLDILRKASSLLSGGSREAIQWFTFERLVELGNKTAAQLIEAGHAHAVLAYLERAEHGVFG